MIVWVLLIWLSGVGIENPEIWVFQDRDECRAFAASQAAWNRSIDACRERHLILQTSSKER